MQCILKTAEHRKCGHRLDSVHITTFFSVPFRKPFDFTRPLRNCGSLFSLDKLYPRVSHTHLPNPAPTFLLFHSENHSCEFGFLHTPLTPFCLVLFVPPGNKSLIMNRWLLSVVAPTQKKISTECGQRRKHTPPSL